MITNEELLLIKEEVWDKVKKYSCGIELWGSKCLDFIENCHDIDVVVLYNKDKNKETLRKILFKDNSHKKKMAFLWKLLIIFVLKLDQ